MENLKNYLEISPEVQSAICENKPIVALESTIISHGMPYPDNIEFAKEVEDLIRKNGAVPATIAIINGKLKVGLNNEEIEMLSDSSKVAKVSRRDIPMVISSKKLGATTVATTMIIAELAGISVFATGGIGGVHRGATETFDISADLEELARTNVAVVCAGAKSILDIGLTLEYLETRGVPVLGYKTEKFPAFYCSDSGFKVDYKVDDSRSIAEILKAKWEIGLNGGVVIGNPVPSDFSMDKEYMDDVIENALAKASDEQVKGKEITPFLLETIKNITKGSSLVTNIALAKNNAILACNIAKEYVKINN